MPPRRRNPGEEKLPPGFWRTPAKSLRVQVRVKGHDTVVQTFPLFEDTPVARQRQLSTATVWAATIRDRMLGGRHVSTREAEAMTLGDALREYQANGLKGKPSNAAKDRNRIEQILADSIANRSLVSLKTTDIARYRDKLKQDFWEKQVKAKIAALEDQKPPSAVKKTAKALEVEKRVKDLKQLAGLRRKAENRELSSDDRDAARLQIQQIEEREGIREPARTTLGNKIQLITRALKFARQTIDGIPELESVILPESSEGRTRRLDDEEEFQKLLNTASTFDGRLPLLIRFAIETALRRERVLEFSLANIKSIGRGKRVIAFAKGSERRKRTGIIPITREIDEIISAVIAIRGDTDLAPDEPLFGIIPGTLDTWWKRLLKRAEIRDLHFHDLRHEGTSRLFEKGLSTAEVMSITGHSTTEMVERYSHYSAGIVLDKLEQGLNPEKLLSEIKFLIDQYKAVGGDSANIDKALTEAYDPFSRNRYEPIIDCRAELAPPTHRPGR
jgi:integrase